MVRWAEVSRSTKRSPTAAASGVSKHQLHAPFRTGRDRRRLQQSHARADLGGGVVQPDR